MDWPNVAPMIVAVVFMALTAGTILLFPLSRRLGRLVDAIIEEKKRVPSPVDHRIEDVLVRMDTRLARLEDEQRFMAALQSSGSDALSPPSSPAQSIRSAAK